MSVHKSCQSGPAGSLSTKKVFVDVFTDCCFALRGDPIFSPRFDPPLFMYQRLFLVNVGVSFRVFLAASELALKR